MIYHAAYFILGVKLSLSSNRETLFNNFDYIYHHFKVNGTDPAGDHPEFELSLLSDEEGIMMLGPGIKLQIQTPEVPQTLYLYLLNFVYHVSDRLIFHGGAVARNGKGLILCASSSTGKTMLVLELLRRGFDFLSDELAPILHERGLIEPFPRAIGLREGAMELHPWILGTLGEEGKNTKGEFKGFYDPERLPGVRAGKDVPPYAVIFLAPSGEEGDLSDEMEYLEIGFSNIPSGLLDNLANLRGILNVEILSDRYYPMLRLKVQKGISVTGEIEHISRAMGVPIIISRWGRSNPPRFDSSPVLKRLSSAEGLMQWNKYLLNGRYPSRLLKMHSGSAGRIILSLSDLARETRFYNLTVGSLSKMGDEIERLIEEV